MIEAIIFIMILGVVFFYMTKLIVSYMLKDYCCKCKEKSKLERLREANED
jgi:hypothetical protein